MSILRRGVGLAAWTMAICAVAAGGLAQGGRISLALDALTHLAPLYIAAGLLAMAFAVLAGARSYRAPLLLGAAAAVLSASLVAPEFLARDHTPPATGAGRPMKVVQFNTWVGNRDAAEVARWLLAQNADVIVLEEGAPVRSRLMAAGYLPACYGCSPVIFARARPLRRYPPPRVWNDSSRITWATYADPGGEFTVVAVHGHWPDAPGDVRAQAIALRQHLSRLPAERLILAGDFNSTPWSFARRRDDAELGLIRRTRGLPTWPAAAVSHNRLPIPFPYLPIDHVYAGRAWATVSVERGPRLGSDHYPVVVTLAPVSRTANMTKISRSAGSR